MNGVVWDNNYLRNETKARLKKNERNTVVGLQVPPGPPRIDNGAHGTGKLQLKLKQEVKILHSEVYLRECFELIKLLLLCFLSKIYFNE